MGPFEPWGSHEGAYPAQDKAGRGDYYRMSRVVFDVGGCVCVCVWGGGPARFGYRCERPHFGHGDPNADGRVFPMSPSSRVRKFPRSRQKGPPVLTDRRRDDSPYRCVGRESALFIKIAATAIIDVVVAASVKITQSGLSARPFNLRAPMGLSADARHRNALDSRPDNKGGEGSPETTRNGGIRK